MTPRPRRNSDEHNTAIGVCASFIKQLAYPGEPPVSFNISLTIPANQRYTVWLGALQFNGGPLPSGSYAAVFTSSTAGKEVYVAQSSYFVGDWDDGTGYGAYATQRWEASFGEPGMTSAPRFYFAEGGSLNPGTLVIPDRANFRNFYKLFNPNAAALTIRFKLTQTPLSPWHPQYPPCTTTLSVPAHGLGEFWLDYMVRQPGICPGWEPSPSIQQGDVAAELESTDGRLFAAALTMYQTQQPNRGPSATLANGITDPDRVLVVPEASFGGWPLSCTPYYSEPESWQPRFYVFNPSDTATATINMYLLGEGAQPSEHRVPNGGQNQVAPRKRLNIDGQFEMGNPAPCGNFSAVPYSAPYGSGIPLVMNKVQYWGRDWNWVEGVNSPALTGTGSSKWLVPSGSNKAVYPTTFNAGYTFDGLLEQYIHVYSSVAATVTVKYIFGSDTPGCSTPPPLTKTYAIGAIRHLEIESSEEIWDDPNVNYGACGKRRLDHAAVITASAPIWVEYVNFLNLQTVGTAPTDRMWRAAEGGLGIRVQ